MSCLRHLVSKGTRRKNINQLVCSGLVPNCDYGYNVFILRDSHDELRNPALFFYKDGFCIKVFFCIKNLLLTKTLESNETDIFRLASLIENQS